MNYFRDPERVLKNKAENLATGKAKIDKDYDMCNNVCSKLL